jgi:hypothetical protein
MNTLSIQLPSSTPDERIRKALSIAVEYGGIDGAHHKDWVIDQMARALTGCPVIEKEAKDHAGTPYPYPIQGESEAYHSLVRDACAGVDGPNTYAWDTGVAP